MQVSAHACSATERLLLLLGWERVVSSAPRSNRANVRDEAYVSLQADLQRRKGQTKTDSSWERERPQLRMPAVSAPVVAARNAESSWASDAFEVGEHTGTV